MREIRNTKIIAVDHGYGNIKTANTVTPTGITAYETEPIFTGNILEYNGIYYRIGEGHKEFIPDKAMDEDYYLLTLMAVAQELNVFSIHEADVHLAAGLPLTWIRNQREAFRSYLLQNPEVRFSFNSKNYHIRFVGCSLYPQGYPAVVNFDRYYRTQEDPYLETREREEQFVNQIVEAVERSLEQALPLFLSGLTAGLTQREPQNRASFPAPEESGPEADIDWDFLGE